MMRVQDKILIHEWVCKALEGTISEAESRRLQEVLVAEPQAIRYYQSCIHVNAGLQKIQPLLADSFAMSLCLEEMAEYEKNAEVIHVAEPDDDTQRTPVQLAPVSAPARQNSRMLLYTAILSTAALLLMMLYVYHNPRPIRQEVATLIDSLNAEWRNPEHALRNGQRVMTAQGPAVLDRGMVKLLYDDGVEVVIEGPAEYELLSSMEIALYDGRLFASVSDAGKGFTVRTQNTRIIDLGTEFGVASDAGGNTELHVFKGKTALIAGFERKQKEIVEVSARQARRVDALNADIRAIELAATGFARAFDSRKRTVWRGESVVDLAYVLGGDLIPMGADEAALTRLPETRWLRPQQDELGPGMFQPIADNPFVNGIFLPNGVDGPIAVSTDAQLRWEAPLSPVRQKISFLRFDIRSLSGDPSGAVLRLNVRDMVGAGKPIAVYGLVREDLDAWSEAQLSYRNAPGLRDAPLGRYVLDTTVLQRLGTITFSDSGAHYSDPDRLFLDDFVRRDTNGLLTLALLCEDSDLSAEWRFVSKEGDPSQAPALIFPHAENGPVEVTTAHGNGADTYAAHDNHHKVITTEMTHGAETAVRVRNYWKETILITNADTVAFDAADGGATCTFSLSQRPVGTAANPAVAMRANAGVTFDLHQMQRCVPENRPPRRFTAVCGVPENMADYSTVYRDGYVPSVNVYVLVDGRLRFTRTDVNPTREPERIRLELTPDDRYLTLVVTSATEQKTPFDWCLFVRPRILFE